MCFSGVRRAISPCKRSRKRWPGCKYTAGTVPLMLVTRFIQPLLACLGSVAYHGGAEEGNGGGRNVEANLQKEKEALDQEMQAATSQVSRAFTVSKSRRHALLGCVPPKLASAEVASRLQVKSIEEHLANASTSMKAR
jgi:hypothetical protein